jgi:hypothetical protein
VVTALQDTILIYKHHTANLVNLDILVVSQQPIYAIIVPEEHFPHQIHLSVATAIQDTILIFKHQHTANPVNLDILAVP